MPHLTEEKKNKIKSLLMQGLPYRQIASQCHVSISTISLLKQQTENDQSRNHPGRKKKFTARQRRWIIRQITSGRISSAQGMLPVIQKEMNINVSVATVKRALKQEGLVSFKRQKKPYINSRIRRLRREFAEKHQHWTIDDWKRVIWSDEVKINRIGSDGIRWGWRRRDTEPTSKDYRKSEKFGGGYLIMWGCMTYFGIGYACRIDGRLDSTLYVEILKGELEQTLEYYNMEKENIIFQQDNAPPHKAKVVKEYFEDSKLIVMDWPPNSPDLNPIEHLWSIIKVQLGKYPEEPKGMIELWQRVQNQWNSISENICKTLIESMPNRISAVIKARGGNTQY